MEFAGSHFEIKSIDDAGLIEGIAAGFGNVDHGGDKILAGAFTKTLAERGGRPLPMLHSHDLKRPIGAWTKWQETPSGLHVSGKITLATRDAQEAHALAKDGALTGISVGWLPDGKPQFENSGVRVLPSVKLFEASLVAVPMNDRAQVTSIKSIAGPRDIAELLQEAGMSSRRAKTAAGAAWKAINEQEDEAAAQADLAQIFAASAKRIAVIGNFPERTYW